MHVKNETINKLQNEVRQVKRQLEAKENITPTELATPSRGGILGNLRPGERHVLPSCGKNDNLYADVVKGTSAKRYKLTVKSKTNQSTEEVKNHLKSNINPTEIKVGINTFKSLKDGRVLIEASSKEEINALSAKINEKCGKQLDVHVPKLWKPRLIVYNVPDDILVDNIENTIISQNPELDLKPGDITARFKIQTRKKTKPHGH